MQFADPIIKELQNARIKLLLEWPIFAPIILQLELVEVDWCPTAATDGRHFYFNREFVKKLDRAQLLFLTAHECLHIIYDHLFRRGRRNKDIWNCAVDYIVNYSLIHTADKAGKTIGRTIENVYPVEKVLYDPAYTDEFSAEELYALLEKNIIEIKLPLDMHLDLDADGSGDGGKEEAQNGDTEDGGDRLDDGKAGPPKISSEEADAIRDNLRAALIQAAQQSGLDPGKLPAGILRLLNKLLEPKIDWRQMLDNVLRSAIKHDFTYTRLSRRFWSSQLILPGQDVMDKVMAVAFLDGSGSTTKEMVTDFLSECKGIMTTFADFELTIGTFDTEVYEVRTYTPDNADEIEQYPFKGGGGTRPTCCWEYMKAHDIEPHRLLLFTDGWVGNDWGEPDYCDTLFIVHSNPSAKAPYGITTHYESRE